MIKDLVYSNGINLDTGEYLLDPMTKGEFIQYTKNSKQPKSLLRLLEDIWFSISKKELQDPGDGSLSNIWEAGWGIIFHEAESQELRDIFKPLIAHRKSQIHDERLVGSFEYSDEQSLEKWLIKYGLEPGIKDKYLIPYYLLIVGDPEIIPFWFSRLLDVDYAVGRVHFDDLVDYERYISSIIEYEISEKVRGRRSTAFFATRHPDDESTRLSADYLVGSLIDRTKNLVKSSEMTPVIENLRSDVEVYIEHDARKQTLTDILTLRDDERRPHLLFTATHGTGSTEYSDSQRLNQGALVCQDWKGRGKLKKDHYFSVHDITDEYKFQGMLFFCFACFSAGTPRYDQFLFVKGASPRQLVPSPFVAALPKAVLSHSDGGALAWIGHIDRTWSSSFIMRDQRLIVRPFINCIQSIQSGLPIGFSMKEFNERFAALSISISEMQHQVELDMPFAEKEFIQSWILRNDAGGYLIIGDPAVSLRTHDE